MKSQINSFDRPTVKLLRTELDATLASLSAKYGITIETGNARFSEHECGFKIKLNTTCEDGSKKETKEAIAWNLYRASLGLSHIEVGHEFTLQGRQFKLTGYNTRARKSPINIQDLKGANYKLSTNMLKNNLI